jgi:predicted dehydrogenase
MDQAVKETSPTMAPRPARPRLGFLGVGWIGANRLKSLVQSHAADVVAICDPNTDNCGQVLEMCPGAERVSDLQNLLTMGLDGIVIATPSAQHAGQALAVLKAGLPVFCQKPLALSAGATREVIAAARAADRLLGVDLSYRHLRGLDRMRSLIRQGSIGKIYAVDLIFHNAYGPDKPWYYEKAGAGGGCVIDLGTHLVDLMLWVLDHPEVSTVVADLYAGGQRLCGRPVVEDYAAVQIRLHNDISVRLACSWHLQAGREAVIQATFYGTEGGLSIRNVHGSFFDFQAERYKGTQTQILEPPSADWWGAAAVQWACRLGINPGYDAQVEGLITVAEILDAIYGESWGEKDNRSDPEAGVGK